LTGIQRRERELSLELAFGISIDVLKSVQDFKIAKMWLGRHPG
jgi:hypothetical protein